MGMLVSVRAPQMGLALEQQPYNPPPVALEEFPYEPTPEEIVIVPPPPTQGTIGTTPGSVPVVASAWNFETHPATYEAQQGDTFTGLAKTYLPSSPPGVRWKEIWNLNRDTHPNPDRIGVGDVLNMPDDAATNAKSAIQKGDTSDAPEGEKSGSLGRAMLIGAAIAVLGTGIAYGANYIAKRTKKRAPQLRAA